MLNFNNRKFKIFLHWLSVNQSLKKIVSTHVISYVTPVKENFKPENPFIEFLQHLQKNGIIASFKCCIYKNILNHTEFNITVWFKYNNQTPIFKKISVVSARVFTKNSRVIFLCTINNKLFNISNNFKSKVKNLNIIQIIM